MTDALTTVLYRAYTSPFSTKSNFARDHATLVAQASSRGLITAFIPGFGFGNLWHITATGLTVLNMENYDPTNGRLLAHY